VQKLYLNNTDLPLIESFEIDTDIEQGVDKVELHIFSLDNRLLYSDQNFTDYSVIKGGARKKENIEDITLDPQKDATNAGYPDGDVNLLYNFTRNVFSKSREDLKLFIESISPDRTELRLLSNEITDSSIESVVKSIRSKLQENPYFEEFRLNFGESNLPIVVNVDTQVIEGKTYLLAKLYEPLSRNFSLKTECSLEQLVSDSVLFQVKVEAAQEESKLNYLRGPNFDIELIEDTKNPSQYFNFNELLSYPVTNSYYEIYSLINESGSNISIDHTSYDNFVHFSSAEERLRNFRYKLQLIESNQTSIDTAQTAGKTETGSYVSTIESIVRNFDHYDRFLYYESGSFSWPKTNSSRPYTLASTTSSLANTWYSSALISASDYDSVNPDRLTYTVPAFIREDSNNSSYLLFLDMIGQHFDNIWVYQKAVTDKYDADNRLNYGVSKDLVRDLLQNFGVKLYESNQSLDNLFSTFVGNPYNSGSEFFSSGSEVINKTIIAVTGSSNSHLQPIPKDSYLKEIYKRIYHNLPLLLKSKGTERGLRTLINTYGIPSDILNITTFGGGDKDSDVYYGSENFTTSSLDKIRIESKETIITGSTLSYNTNVTSGSSRYSTDLHSIQLGFSPTDSVNEFIKAEVTGSFNIDQYIGDPRLAHSSSYNNLRSFTETIFTTGSKFIDQYNVQEFVRLIKFYDNSIFRIVKEFIPARSNLSSGIVIKPHILERSKHPVPKANWSNQNNKPHQGTFLDYTGSFYQDNFYYEGTINTAHVSGTSGLDNSLTASYSESYTLPSGGFSYDSRNNQNEPFFNGEYSGSYLRASDGELNRDNDVKKNTPITFSFRFRPLKTGLFYPFVVSTGSADSATACSTPTSTTIYGTSSTFSNNTSFYTNVSSDNLYIDNSGNNWISDLSNSLQLDSTTGEVIDTDVCSVPATRYSFSVSVGSTSDSACNNSPSLTIEGLNSTFENNTFFYEDVCPTVTPTPTPTPTLTPSSTPSTSVTPTPTLTVSVTPTADCNLDFTATLGGPP